MIVDIHWKIEHFDGKDAERVCFICAVRAATETINDDITDTSRVKLKSGRKPVTCERCGNFIHDTINTGYGDKEERDALLNSAG